MCRFLGRVFCLLFVFSITKSELAVIFTEQPENTTAQEGTTTTFSCAVNNTAFEIVWYINDTDASHTIIEQQGVKIIDNEQTSSQLVVNASQSNNNSYVHCTAFQFVVRPFFGFKSENAFLRVEAMSKQQSSHISTIGTLTPANLSTRSIVPLSETDIPERSEQPPKALIAVVIAASITVVAVLTVVCLSIVILATRYHSRTQDQKKNSSIENIKMAPNIPYEYRQPMRLEMNIAYDDVKLHAVP